MSSKSAKKAKAVQQTAQNNTAQVGSPGATCTVLHFFRVKVVDDEGNIVTDVNPRIELNDGTVVNAAPLNAAGVYDTGKILPAATPCKVSFPTLYDSDWWPDGDKGGGFSVDQQINIADGDCVVKVAADKGFRNYRSLWDRSKNATLKTNHPNPNALVIGDIVWAPDQKTLSVSKAVDQEWKFVIKTAKPCKLSVVLVDKEEKPLNDWDWELTAPAAKTGKTAANGLIEIDNLDPTQLNGSFKMKLRKAQPPPPVVPPPGPLPNPPPYPAAIKPAEFKDESPVKPADSDKMEWTVKIGSLPSHKDQTGVLARLRNLGYNCDVTSVDPILTAVIKSYQKAVLKQDNPTGSQADLQQPLEDRHSNP